MMALSRVTDSWIGVNSTDGIQVTDESLVEDNYIIANPVRGVLVTGNDNVIRGNRLGNNGTGISFNIATSKTVVDQNVFEGNVNDILDTLGLNKTADTICDPVFFVPNITLD